MKATTHALKEWNVAVNALEQGQTILLLRKGGIREQGGHFQVTNKEILLYPTFEHQQPYLLKSEYANQVNPVQSGWHPDSIRISSWAEITDTFLVAYEKAIASIFPYHIWNEKFVSERLKWKPSQPIYILLLRTYRLPQIHDIPYRSEYSGCRSWIELAQPIERKDSLPVLSDREYKRVATEIRNAIAHPPSILSQKITDF